jgi:hypothetical protein
MKRPKGDVPIKAFQRRLLGAAFRIFGGALLTIAVCGWLFGKRGFQAGILLALVVVLVLITLEIINRPRCPVCGALADLTPESRTQWRYRFPYGWATHCPSCGTDLTKPQ